MVPVLAPGADPGRTHAVGPLAIRDRLLVERSLVDEHAPERLFAYEVTRATCDTCGGWPSLETTSSSAAAGGPPRTGSAPCARRAGVVLSRVLIVGDAVVLRPATGARVSDAPVIEGLEARRGGDRGDPRARHQTLNVATAAADDPNDGQELSQARATRSVSVILGKPEAIEHVLVALLAGAPPAAGGRARRRQDDARQGARALLRRRVQARAVHAGPAAGGHPRLVGAEPARRHASPSSPGPVFTHVLLADEINRASPRTQSALLEAMSERQVSIDGETRTLPAPFLVLATQNPVEFHGTYPLPEAQLDRFGMRLSPRLPRRGATRSTCSSRRPGSTRSRRWRPCSRPRSVLALQAEARCVDVERLDRRLRRGARRGDAPPPVRQARLLAPRQPDALPRRAGARAARGPALRVPEDVKAEAVPVLAHRLGPRDEGALLGRRQGGRRARDPRRHGRPLLRRRMPGAEAGSLDRLIEEQLHRALAALVLAAGG